MNVDKEHVTGYFQNIIHICERTTTGNLSHQMSNIRITYRYIAGKVKEQYGEIMAYHNLMHIVELTSKVTICTGIYPNTKGVRGIIITSSNNQDIGREAEYASNGVEMFNGEITLKQVW